MADVPEQSSAAKGVDSIGRVWLDYVGGPVPPLVGAWIAAIALDSFHSPNLALLTSLGFLGAFLAGLVGVGGAIVMIPLLLYIPPLFGMRPEGIHGVAGVTMVQVAATGIVGMLAHRRAGHVEAGLVGSLGITMVLASFGGALFSGSISPSILNGVFASLAVVASILMLFGGRLVPLESPGSTVAFNRVLAAALGAGVGILVGMVGAGGGFMLVPLMVYLLKVPMRTAVGTSLAIVALSGISGSVGKAAAGQVDWYLALALVSGALPGAQLGSVVSRRTPAHRLATALGLLIAVIAGRMWWELLAP